MRRILSSLILLGAMFAVTLYAATGTPSSLIVRTDANSNLVVTAVTQVNPVTSGVFSSRTLRTDSSGNLQVILSGTVTPTYPLSVPASTCAAPSIGESGAATTGIAFTATPSILMCIAGTAIETITGSDVGTTDVTNTLTRLALGTTSTDGLITQNTTASTGAITAQISPRSRWSGTGWDSDDSVSRTVSYFIENLPVTGTTVTQLFKIGYINPAGTVTYPVILDGSNITSSTFMTLLGGFNTGASITVGGNVRVDATANIRWNGASTMRGPNALWQVTDSTEGFGIQINTGTAAPTVTSCGTGTIDSGSRNTVGGFTATGATACTVTFGTPSWTNTPWCVVTLENSTVLTSPYVSARSTSAFTVSGLTAGDKISYHCLGRI